MEPNRNCLSFWLPRLLAAGVPVPRTEIVRSHCDLIQLCDGKMPHGYGDFIDELTAAVERVGLPAFLRTGQGSGKHDWKRTCFVTDVNALTAHVAALVEWSHMVDFFGLAHDVWCVREMLPTEPVAVLPRYGDMPLVKEVRAFVRGGRVVCAHNYWPLGAVQDGLSSAEAHRAGELHAALACDPDDYLAWSPLARRVAEAFADDGAWSVDLLKTKAGWFVTDMAEAARSYHADGCLHAKSFTEAA